MTAVLEVYDQRPGAGRKLRHAFELPAERITARELIRRRVEAEATAHNAAERIRFLKEDTIYQATRDAPNEWLVTPGCVEQALNGARLAYGPRPGVKTPEGMLLIDSEPQVAIALEAFARNGFFMIFDDRQIIDLDEVLIVRRESAVTFLKLTQLVGG